jgi:gliding motility-associated-like protein
LGTQPQWLNPERLTCTYCPVAVADPLVNTQYIAQTQIQPGCIIVDTVAIRVVQPAEYSAGDDNFLCINGNRTLDAFVPEGSSVQWSPANTLNNANIIQPVASPSQDVVYTLTAVLGRCTMKDSVAIQMVTETVISGDEINICKGDSIQLTVAGEADWIRWDNPEYLSANAGATVTAAPPVSIEYYVTGQFSTCPEDTAVFKVNVIDNPEFTLAPVWYYFKGQDVPVAVNLKSEGPHNFYWEDVPGMSCIHCPDPLITPNTETNLYKVRVENTETGCFTLAETRLEERKECELDLVSAPSMFSPNGDGTNDVWNIHLSTALRQGIGTLTIFDRWGSLIFQSNNVALGWDGKINNQPAPMGTYVYTVDVPCEITGLPMRIMGDLNLVR